jgi:hypothetical protein
MVAEVFAQIPVPEPGGGEMDCGISAFQALDGKLRAILEEVMRDLDESPAENSWNIMTRVTCTIGSTNLGHIWYAGC